MLPRVLAGPIVRRVEAGSCSFWVALSEAATVTARVFTGERQVPFPAGTDTPVAEAQLATRPIGAALHVAVVTVDTSGTPLVPGDRYSYDLRFAFTAGGQTSDLAGERLLELETAGNRIPGVDPMAPLQRPIGFVANHLPSFLAPPSSFVDLRLAHASCRRPGAGAVDALGGLATIVADQAARPHQLHLTGDQIYADSVASPFLPMIAALAGELTGAQPLPGFPPDPRTGGTGTTPVTGAGLPGTVANLPLKRRQWLLWQLAGFTGGDTANHLVTFGEFVAHHLFAWSPRVWRAIPDFTTTYATTPAPDPAIAPWLNRPWRCGDHVDQAIDDAILQQHWADPAVNVADFKGFNRSARQLARYAASAPAVAQVLANTPTYMIFDDHEVADDWNLNGRWVAKVYGREWGRFVVRNGLLAFALMQGWGNDPAHFAKDEPGRKLLDAVPSIVAPATAPSAATTAEVDVLLGFPSPPPTPPATPAKRVRWNMRLDAPDYSVVVLDTRTHRDVDDLSLDAPNLVANLDEQLPERPATDSRELLVVVSAVPVFGPAVVEQLGQPLSQLIVDFKHDHHVGEIPGFRPGDLDDPKRAAGCGGRVERGAEKYDREGWGANEPAFEALLARLATYPAVVLLSGDVHYGCTLALDRWPRDTAQPVRIVQCTSSPSKNTFKAQVEEIARHVGNLQRALELPVERLAWEEIDADDLIPDDARLPLARRARLRRKPALVPSAVWPAGSEIPASNPPDWRWRMTPIVDTTTKRTDLPSDLRPAVLPPNLDDEPVVDRFVAVATVHQTLVRESKPLLRRMVFEPNFGTIHFDATGGARRVVHRVHTATTVIRFDENEDLPRPDERPADPTTTFGPHTVHRALLRTPADAEPPTLRTADG